MPPTLTTSHRKLEVCTTLLSEASVRYPVLLVLYSAPNGSLRPLMQAARRQIVQPWQRTRPTSTLTPYLSSTVDIQLKIIDLGLDARHEAALVVLDVPIHNNALCR